MLTTDEIRKTYLDFFQEKGHTLVDSASLVPNNDNTLLFTNAGMVPFKDLLLGVEKRKYTRAVSSQRCIRAGGKHNDLDNVGYTARHHTFFEMLGNFSFGDYFKEEAIAFAWELLTERYKIPPEKLWITVHEDDDESEEIWIKKIGIDPSRVSKLDDEENFWTMGETGPCGPCSEIYYDHGDHLEGDPPRLGSDPGDRYIEIWNLVFTQFDRDVEGNLLPLPNPCVDTGMGLERMAAVLQNQHNNYDTDLLKALVTGAADLAHENDLSNPSLRVIADHLRASSFLIADGVVPSNEGRGYVLRRIIRRALRHAFKLGMDDSPLSQLSPLLQKVMGKEHPVLEKNSEIIAANLLQEENQFSSTLSQGMQLLESEVQKLSGTEISGHTVFKLYDTFGFPVDMTADFARERGLTIDMDLYQSLMEEQKERARMASNFVSLIPESLNLDSQTNFVGYENSSSSSSIVKIISQTKENFLEEEQEGIFIIKETPFYAESGGQVGDKGIITSDTNLFEVYDTQKKGDHFLHLGVVKSGFFKEGDSVFAEIDSTHRERVSNNHSATHLLHSALRETLGTHVEQKGSLVDQYKLRFDFSHKGPINEKEMSKIEKVVQEEIFKDTSPNTKLMSFEEAKKTGALAFFGEKYGDEVRVVNIGNGFSVELCGGTHVKSTSAIGLMKVTSETGVSAGVRRVEAVTGDGALLLLEELETQYAAICAELMVEDLIRKEGVKAFEMIEFLEMEISLISKILNCNNDQILKKIIQIKEENQDLKTQIDKNTQDFKEYSSLQESVESLLEINTELKKQIKSIQSKDIGVLIEESIKKSITVEGLNLVLDTFDEVDSKSLREIADSIRTRISDSVVALISVSSEKAPVIVACSKEVEIDAREVMKHLINQLGGSGGGRQDFAQGGIENTENLDIALSSVADLIVSLNKQ